MNGQNSGPNSPKILCYAPYNMWQLHGMWELTILHALRLRGADIHYVMCDGLYSDCDMFWKSTRPRDEFSCSQCMAKCATFLHDMRFPYEWLGRYSHPSEIAKAREWAKNLPRKELYNASYRDWKIGEWVKTSVHSNFRRSYLDLEDPETEATFRSYLSSGLIAAFSLNRLIEFAKPDILFLFNGRFSSIRIALELARQKGIRFLTHERGRLMESFRIVDGDLTISLKPRLEVNHAWSEIPLDRKELEQVTDYMMSRRYGKKMSWKSYSPPPQTQDNLIRKLELNPAYPTWSLFTSSDDEIIAFEERKSTFATQLDWVKETIAFARTHPNLNLVIRVHPNTAGKMATGNNALQLAELKALIPSLPGNTRMVLPEDPVSSYTLMDISDLGLVYMSTVGLEMACLGKPAIMAAPSIITDMPCVPTLKSTDEYQPLLEKYFNGPVGCDPVKLRQYGHRWAYSHFFRPSIPFPLVKMPTIHKGVLAYNDTRALLPGNDAALDSICRVFLENEPAVPPPGPVELARDDTLEKQLFQQNIYAEKQTAGLNDIP